MRTASEELATLLANLPYRARVVEKTTWFWRLLGRLVTIVTLGRNRMFMTCYVTTIGNVIAVPEGFFASADNPVSNVALIRHELEHVRQCRMLGLGSVWLGFPLYAILYLLIPLPLGFAWFRYLFERRAYLESTLVFHQNGASSEQIQTLVEHAVRQLTSGLYGWTWPFPARVRAYFKANLANLESGFAIKED